jgi:acetoacetate decarboxylase
MTDNEPKFGRLTPDHWGETMPAHSASYGRGPWYYRDTEAIMLTYMTDEDAALDILPSDMQLVTVKSTPVSWRPLRARYTATPMQFTSPPKTP